MRIHLTPLLAANRYCALSNLQSFDAIAAMIDPNDACVYGNRGTDNIMTGIKSFHEKYCNVFWIFKSYSEEANASKILVDFDRYWSQKQEDSSTAIYCSSASEIIEFSSEGLILSIAYRSHPTEPQLFGHSYPDSRNKVLDECRTTVVNTE